jgi:hypothetical protein
MRLNAIIAFIAIAACGGVDLPAGPDFLPPTKKECAETFCGFAPGSTIGVDSEGHCLCGCQSAVPGSTYVDYSYMKTFETMWPPSQEFVNEQLAEWEAICPSDTLFH